MPAHPFAPGFRISAVDVLVLILGAVATIVLGSMTWWWGFIIGFVVGHFFLFCNVFRIARSLELIWAAVFTLLAGGSILNDVPSWQVTIVASLVVTVIVIAVELRKPSYHGIGWQRVNPRLPEWWESCGPGTRSDTHQEV